jgi:hypothetical protein
VIRLAVARLRDQLSDDKLRTELIALAVQGQEPPSPAERAWALLAWGLVHWNRATRRHEPSCQREPAVLSACRASQAHSRTASALSRVRASVSQVGRAYRHCSALRSGLSLVCGPVLSPLGRHRQHTGRPAGYVTSS